jgi:hypothetical protein
MSEKPKYEMLKIEFVCQDTLTEKMVQRLQKKVLTFMKNTGYDAIVSYFISGQEVQFIVGLDVQHGGKPWLELNSLVQRLIDSHKEAAYSSWGETYDYSKFAQKIAS